MKTFRLLLFLSTVCPALAEKETDVPANAAERHFSEMVAKARETGSLRSFHDLSRFPERVSAAGDLLVGLLDDPDPNIRLGACRALGFADRLDLWPQIARALKDPDWRVSFSACLALANLKAKGADPSLKNLSETHWYPRVRHAAEYARHRIRGAEPPEIHARHLGSGVPSVSPEAPEDYFFVYELADRLLSPWHHEMREMRELQEKPGAILIWGPLPSDLETAASRHPSLHRAISSISGTVAAEDWKRMCSMTGLLEQEQTTLVALDAGEWVGGLFAVDREGGAARIMHDNIVALLEWNGKIVTLSGMHHMGMDRGALHELIHEKGTWKPRFLHALPGCPDSGRIDADGNLIVNASGGAVAIGKDGRFKYLGSGQSPPEE